MTPAMHHRSPARRQSPYLSDSPDRNHHPSHTRSSHHKEGSPGHHRSSVRMKSPSRMNASHRKRSPAREKLPNRIRSPKQERSRSPWKEKLPNHLRSPEHRRSPIRRQSRSPVETGIRRSPSPRTKRSRRAVEDRETEDLMDKEHGRDAARGRDKEHVPTRENFTKKRPLHEKSDARSSRSIARDRSVSPAERSHRSKHGSPSRSYKSRARDEATNASEAEQHRDGEDDSVSKMKAAEEALEAKQKEKPSFELSGKLAEETNRFRGVTLLFTEPAEARKPDIRWRLYVFKGGEVLNEPLYVHRQSCYLFGRERRVADIPTDHPSCSKQHAVIQYRLVEKEQPDGMMKKQVRPYLMDLGSTNGTFINDNRLEPQRYYELFEKDTIKFGNSSREYVILHENSVQ